MGVHQELEKVTEDRDMLLDITLFRLRRVAKDVCIDGIVTATLVLTQLCICFRFTFLDKWNGFCQLEHKLLKGN